jgi:hypothetical protein
MMRSSIRRRFARRGVAGLAALALGGLATGCGGAPQYRYLSDSRSGIVVQLPQTWVDIDGADVLAVTADRIPEADNALVSHWVAGFAARSGVDPGTIFTPTQDQPGGFVRSRYLLNSELFDGGPTRLSVQVLLNQLNDLAMLPPGGNVTERQSFGVITDSGANGVRYDLTLTFPDGAIRLQYIAVADIERQFVDTLVIGCSTACYEANRDQIERVVSTFTVIEGQGGVRR